MDKLQEKLNKIDNIIGQIEKDNNLKKNNQGVNLKRIVELDKRDKDNLEKKMETIKRFSAKLENIISNKPEPETLDAKLVDYIGYADYYMQNTSK
jgi:type I restriction-modification system DNA methylase subunit